MTDNKVDNNTIVDILSKSKNALTSLLKYDYESIENNGEQLM